MGDFFKILLIAILIFYVFNIITRWIFKRKLKKLQQQMEQFTEDGSESQPEEEQKPHVDPSIGEYTDFEEIE